MKIISLPLLGGAIAVLAIFGGCSAEPPPAPVTTASVPDQAVAPAVPPAEAAAAVKPLSSDAAVDLWTSSIRSDDGTLQLALLSKSLQESMRAAYASLNGKPYYSVPNMQSAKIITHDERVSDTSGEAYFRIAVSSAKQDKVFALKLIWEQDRWRIDSVGQAVPLKLSEEVTLMPFQEQAVAWNRLELNMTTFGIHPQIEKNPIQFIMGNHAEALYEEKIWGPFGEAVLSLVQRDKYNWDESADRHFDGYTYEYWLYALQDVPERQFGKVAYTISAVVQESVEEARDSMKKLAVNWHIPDHPFSGEMPPPQAEDRSDASDIYIVSADFRRQTVTIANRGRSEQNMSGWTLAATQQRQSYRFPDDFHLQAGNRVTIGSGLSEAGTPPSSDRLLWTENYVWSYGGDQAVLYDPQNRVQSHLERYSQVGPPPPDYQWTEQNNPSVIARKDVIQTALAKLHSAYPAAKSYAIRSVALGKAGNGPDQWQIVLRAGADAAGGSANIVLDARDGEIRSLTFAPASSGDAGPDAAAAAPEPAMLRDRALALCRTLWGDLAGNATVVGMNIRGQGGEVILGDDRPEHDIIRISLFPNMVIASKGRP